MADRARGACRGAIGGDELALVALDASLPGRARPRDRGIAVLARDTEAADALAGAVATGKADAAAVAAVCSLGNYNAAIDQAEDEMHAFGRSSRMNIYLAMHTRR